MVGAKWYLVWLSLIRELKGYVSLTVIPICIDMENQPDILVDLHPFGYTHPTLVFL
jgi:hypothetical protein